MKAAPAPRGTEPSRWYSCGICPSGQFSADMSKAEAIKHAALVHDRVIRPTRVPVLALRST